MYQQRGGNFLAGLPQVTKTLLIANVVVFLVAFLGMAESITNWLALYSPGYLFKGGYHFKPFQLISHMFMHGGLGHVFMNMFGLVIFGKVLEHSIGSQKFFLLYFISGLGAAGLQLLAYNFQEVPAIMVGASGAVFGVVTAFAVMYPNVELMLLFIPVPIKAKYMIPGFIVISLFMGLNNFEKDNIAHFAHIGGALIGFLLIKYWKKNQFRQY